MTKPEITVVIPAYNAAGTIDECLTALANQVCSLPFEVIVVDDGSTDGTADIAATYPNVTVITQQNGYAAAARNKGIAAAQGDIICLTDADCAPREDWIEQISQPLRDNSDVIGSKGTYLTKQKSLTARFVQVEYEDKYDLLLPQENIDFIDTYSAAYRRDVLLANDGFDEKFPYLEDQELSFRLAARGYLMRFQPNAVVYHFHRDTVWKYFRTKFVIGYWKAQVVRRFPTRGVKDSHTPQVMKVQMGLVALFLASLLAIFISPWGGLASLLLAVTFAFTTIPFIQKTLTRDKAVAPVAPFLLFVRGLGLGLGYAWGLVKAQAGISGEENTIGGLNYVSKRVLDIIGGVIGLAITAVFFPFIAIAIKTTSKGNIFFRQERIGLSGQPFSILKFRTMHDGAEKELDKLVDFEKLADSPAYKLDNDPRITKVGHYLRRWSLDELPQFWNVLKGDMSLIGPRPEEARVVELYNDWHRRRLAIKPGLSGPMQVNGRGDLSLDERVKLELDYIDTYSVWKDISLIFKTFPALISGKGAR